MRWTVPEVQALHNFLNKYKKSDGSYRRGAITKAAEKFSVSRQTIYNVLEQHPTSPRRQPHTKKLKPKYIAEWETSPTVRDFTESKKNIEKLGQYLSTGREAWKILNKKDPTTWDIEDYKTLWKHERFKDPETGRIRFAHAVAIRQWMVFAKYIDLTKDPYFTTKGLKRAPGRKLTHWIQSEKQFIDVINAIQYPDTLMMFNIGIQCGGRHSSLRLIKPEDIMYANSTIKMFEPKTKDMVERIFLKPTLENLRRYIMHFDFKGGQRIFPNSITNINEDLKQAGEKARIPFDLTSHVGMKHTFASFAANRGVSLEIISLQTGTDPGTLMKFYAGIGQGKIRHELLGEPYREPDWHEVMIKLQPIIAARFNQIKGHLRLRDKLKPRTKEKQRRAQKKARINWSSVEKLIEAKKTPEPLRKAWKKALALHRKGYTDAQVKKEMGWR